MSTYGVDIRRGSVCLLFAETMKIYFYVFSLVLLVVSAFVLIHSNCFFTTRNNTIAYLQVGHPSIADDVVPPQVGHPSTDDVVPFSAYFDRRPRGLFKNATVILVSVAQHIRREITVSCEIDGRVAPNTLFRDIVLSSWINHNFKLTHTDCILYCYDMEVNRNSTVNLIYRASGKVWSTLVRSAVLLPDVGPEKDSVMVCATGYGQPDYLDQWLVYQQSIKVQFIHLNVHESFLTNLNKSSMLRDLTRTGYVEILVWKEYLNSSQVYYYSQTFKYMDCLYRYQNQYRFMMLVDFDEYFIPIGPTKDVLFYAKDVLERKTNLGSWLITTLIYFCKRKSTEASIPSDGNLTKLYDTNKSHFDHHTGKSIYLMHAVMELHAHKADHFFPPFKQETWKGRSYVAHFTNYERFTKRCSSGS